MTSPAETRELPPPLRPIATPRTPGRLDVAPELGDPSEAITGKNPIVWPLTAPIPIVSPRASESTNRGPDHEASRARGPSPRSVRLVVSLLASLLVASVSGLAYQERHPNWLAAFRNVDRPYEPANATVSAQVRNRVTLVSSTASAVTYRVPVTSYSISVSVAHPCWIVVRSPAGSATPTVATTVLPGASPLVVAVHGSASVTVAARTEAITIAARGAVLDTITAPVLGTAYTFVSAASTTS